MLSVRMESYRAPWIGSTYTFVFSKCADGTSFLMRAAVVAVMHLIA